MMGDYLSKNFNDNCGTPIVVARNFNAFSRKQSTAYFIPTLIKKKNIDGAKNRNLKYLSLQEILFYFFAND
jgi:hypothetical protein